MGKRVASVSIASIKDFSSKLRELPRVVAQKVATAAAPLLTEAAQATFAAGEDPYGVSWDPGAKGQRVDLRETGSLAKYIRYVAVGTKLRVALGVPYAKYQISKRPVFPKQGAPLPKSYADALAKITADTIKAELGT